MGRVFLFVSRSVSNHALPFPLARLLVKTNLTPTPDTLLLLPSGIRVSGVESWVRKLAELMPSLTLTPQEMACVTYGH